MRFVHISDVHLGVTPDAGMPWCQQRKNSIWESFRYVVKRTGELGAELLLISGDLFHGQPLKRELKDVAAMLGDIAPVQVVIIAGNHDYIAEGSYYRSFQWPENVHFILSNTLKEVELPDLDTVVWGSSYFAREDRRIMDASYFQGLSVDKRKINIFLGHGGDEKHRPFRINDILDVGFDYVAMGHIHKPAWLFDRRALMAGALEPTDCNDFGPHGYWVGDISKESDVNLSFFPIKKCEYVRREIGVTPNMSRYEILENIRECLAGRSAYEISHLIFAGRRDADVDMEEIEEFCRQESERIIRIMDETVPDYDFEKLKKDNAGNIVGAFIENIEKKPGSRLTNKALYYGVEALLKSF